MGQGGAVAGLRRPALFLLLSAVLGCGRWEPAAGSAIDLATIPLCDRCRLEPELLLLLGEEDGPGIIETVDTRLAYGEQQGLFATFLPFGGTEILLFDSNGTFLRRIGREGDGPGESRFLRHVEFSGDRIVALDIIRLKMMVWDLEGAHLRDVPLPQPMMPGHFRMASDSTITVGWGRPGLPGSRIRPGATCA